MKQTKCFLIHKRDNNTIRFVNDDLVQVDLDDLDEQSDLVAESIWVICCEGFLDDDFEDEGKDDRSKEMIYYCN